MRRLLSILLALALGLGPGLAAIPASALASGWGATADESRLPACCRRNGAHHCVMSQAQKQAMLNGSTETSVSAVNCCPSFPHSLATSVTVDHALAGKATHQTLLIVERRTALASEATAQVSLRRTWPKRGPPLSSLL
jgi:hypothetical protein